MIDLPNEVADLIKVDAIRPLKETYQHLNELHEVSGVYCFWWIDQLAPPLDIEAIFQGPQTDEATAAKTQKETIIKAPENGRKIYYKKYRDKLYSDSEHRLIKTPYCPLYVGKSTNMSKRIRDHIMKGTKGRDEYLKDTDKLKFLKYENNRDAEMIIKRNSKCQFRAGMEYIFKNCRSEVAYEAIFEKVGYSYVEIEEDQFRHRFYIEDLAIGLLRPPFNLDSER